MTDKDPYLIETTDGSHSIYLPSLKETYHSGHGAITESIHVFIKAGLEYYHGHHQDDEVKIFEVGFGTGLNALLAMQWGAENNVKLNYHSIEAFPLSQEISSKLNYGKLLNAEEKFKSLYDAHWDEEVQLSEDFILKKIKAEWATCNITDKYDIIFYDAFAPSKQPEMWSADLIHKAYSILNTRGLLVTYCAQGQFKRDLKAAGFEVETLIGPPGKKEMVRAECGEQRAE